MLLFNNNFINEVKMKVIRVSPNHYSTVDDSYFPILSQYTWRYNKGYAETTVDGKTTGMHRLVMDAKQGAVVDHINHNKLDNRKSNLRVVTVQANGLNRWGNKNNSSGHRGVYQLPNGKYFAQIKVNGKDFSLGTYSTKEEASTAYLEAHETMRRLHHVLV